MSLEGLIDRIDDTNVNETMDSFIKLSKGGICLEYTQQNQWWIYFKTKLIDPRDSGYNYEDRILHIKVNGGTLKEALLRLLKLYESKQQEIKKVLLEQLEELERSV